MKNKKKKIKIFKQFFIILCKILNVVCRLTSLKIADCTFVTEN